MYSQFYTSIFKGSEKMSCLYHNQAFDQQGLP